MFAADVPEELRAQARAVKEEEELTRKKEAMEKAVKKRKNHSRVCLPAMLHAVVSFDHAVSVRICRVQSVNERRRVSMRPVAKHTRN